MSDTIDLTPETPDRSSEARPLILEEFSERCMGDPAIAMVLLEKFEAQLHRDLEEMEQGLASGDGDRIACTAHALKGAAAAVAATAIRRVAAEVETLARDNRLDQLATALPALRSEIDRCVAYIPSARSAFAGEKEHKSSSLEE